MKTGKFEVYSRYYLSKKNNVIFESEDLQEALDFAHEEVRKFHGEREIDLACQHEPPVASIGCPIWNGV